MRQENRLRQLEQRRWSVSPSDGRQRLAEFLDSLSGRLSDDECAATASPAMIASLAMRDGHMASAAIQRRAEVLSAEPGPVGMLFKGILGRKA